MPVELPSIRSGRPPSRQRCSLRTALVVSLVAHLVIAAAASLGVYTMLGWDIFPSILLGVLIGYVFVTAATIALCVAGVLLSMRPPVSNRRDLEGRVRAVEAG